MDFEAWYSGLDAETIRLAKLKPFAAASAIYCATGKREKGPRFTARQWLRLIFDYDQRCLCCGQKKEVRKLSPDHIVPIVWGGDNSIANIQPLCKWCNSVKKDLCIDYRFDKSSLWMPGITRPKVQKGLGQRQLT